MTVSQSQKNFSLIAGAIFTLVFLLHLWRIFSGWDLTAEGMVIPMWVSWAGLMITGVLAYFGLAFGFRGGGGSSH